MAVARVGLGSLWRKSRQHPGGWSSTDAYKRGAPSRVCGRLARRGVLVTRKKRASDRRGTPTHLGASVLWWSPVCMTFPTTAFSLRQTPWIKSILS